MDSRAASDERMTKQLLTLVGVLYCLATITLADEPSVLVVQPDSVAGPAVEDQTVVEDQTEVAAADEPVLLVETNGANGATNLFERETLTDGLFGLAREFAEYGLTFGAGLTQVYQIPLAGRMTHGREGRYAASYDIEAEWDLEKAFGIPGAMIFAHVEGGWSDGLDERAIGSLSGVNGDAFGRDPIVLTELFWEQWFLDGRVRFRIGKMDLAGGYTCRHCTVGFDTNSYANDETAQFLNGALVNNPTIPFPNYPLAISVFVEPIDRVYFSMAVADAEGERGRASWDTAFDGDAWFFIFETGITPVIPVFGVDLPGAYRVGFWYDTQDKMRFGTAGMIQGEVPIYIAGSTKHDDIGFYVSIDQMIFKENPSDAGDSQGAGVFFRLGITDRDVNEIHTFWSVGGQYQGLIPTRPADVIGFGVAQLLLSKDAGYADRQETVIEVYYNIEVTPWLHISPSVQHIINAGGDAMGHDATVLGFRAQIDF